MKIKSCKILIALLSIQFACFSELAALPSKSKKSPPGSRGWVVVEKSSETSGDLQNPALNENGAEEIPTRKNLLSDTLTKAGIKPALLEEGAVTFSFHKRLSTRQRKKLSNVKELIVEPNVRLNLYLQEEPKANDAEIMPYGIPMINADKVWPVTKGKGAKVLVIDTGIDSAHVDLTGQLKDGTGFFGGVKGYADDQGHGTHVSGTITAKHNTFGVPGIAPDAEFYIYKACIGIYCDNSAVMSGINWGISKGVNVISMSLGTRAEGVTELQSLHEAVKKAYRAGIVLVAAAGNDGSGIRQSGSEVAAPARYPEVIAVGAVDSNKKLANFSSQGPEISVSAPGVAVLSTALIPPYKRPSYGYLSGTSMATPHVAAVAALIFSHPENCRFKLDASPVLSPEEVRKCLEESAEESPHDTKPGKDINYGAGIINAEKAVLGASSNTTLNSPLNFFAAKITGGVMLNWDPVKNATSYKIYVSSNTNDLGSLVSSTDASPFFHQFLGNSLATFYSVTAVDINGKESLPAKARAL